MNSRPLVILTTRLPPQVCGIGSYSWESHQRWPANWPAVEFLVIDESDDAEQLRDVRVTAFDGRARELARALQRIGAADLMLHYAARAYQRFGCPLWLPSVLRRWKRKFPTSRVMIFFHELPGDSTGITSRHYWLDRIGAGIVRRLATIADVLVTNSEGHVAKLRLIAGQREIDFVPVGSNIPVESGRTPARVATEFVIFGLSFGRLQTLQAFEASIQRWHASGVLTTLHVIGPREDEFSRKAEALLSSWPRSINVNHHGLLPPPEVSRLLLQARFALTNVTSATWSKSSALMACAAHECAVVLADEGALPFPLNYAVREAEVGVIGASEIAERTRALAEWYRTNADWPVTAERLASFWPKEELPRG